LDGFSLLPKNAIEWAKKREGETVWGMPTPALLYEYQKKGVVLEGFVLM